METDCFEVAKPGLFTTIQDLGREGYQQYGMVVSGAMDSFSLQVGNILVGNDRHEAGVEMTLLGPELLFLKETVIAICGGNLSPSLDNSPLPMWKSMRVKEGQLLKFNGRIDGSRSYMAIAGGVCTEKVLGSKSTYVNGELGGYQGRPLTQGDRVKSPTVSFSTSLLAGRGLSERNIPTYEAEKAVRIILGHDKKMFTDESIATFLATPYQITANSDRMGYRLTGQPLRHIGPSEILSEAVTLGTVQVPANGQPIILMADRQTTGGYPRIGTIISVDIPYVAQMVPGETLLFQEVTVEEAQRLYREGEKWLKLLSLEANNK